MRAERLLRIVVLLQSRGKATAGELADELEVSSRTIQRDMEALSGAGVPVYATRGGEGGWELRREYRSSLTGLTASDILSIVVGRTPALLKQLGLDDPGEGPVLKLMGAVSGSAKAQAEHARQRIHVDVDGWNADVTSDPSLPLLQRAVWEDRVVRMRYRASRSSFAVAALGLVFKGGVWYLVAQSDKGIRTYLVARMHDVEVTDEPFDRPDEFDLVSHWQRSQSAFRASFPSFVLKLRVRGDSLVRAGWLYARSKTVSEPDADGWATVVLDTQDEDNALGAIRMLGDEVIVQSPAKVRRLALAEARSFVLNNTRRR